MWVYIPCLFSISSEPISNTRMFSYFVHCILIIVYLLQGSVMEQPLIKHRPHLSMTQSVIDKYYFYHGFGIKAFEGRHIRIRRRSQRIFKIYSIARLTSLKQTMGIRYGHTARRIWYYRCCVNYSDHDICIVSSIFNFVSLSHRKPHQIWAVPFRSFGVLDLKDFVKAYLAFPSFDNERIRTYLMTKSRRILKG